MARRAWRRTALFAALLLTVVILSGCGASNNHARIIDAAVNRQSNALEATIELQPSPVLLDALDHGIPLVFEFSVAVDAGPHQNSRWELSFLPMAHRYRLLIDAGSPRFFSNRVELLAALDHVRLPLPATNSVAGTLGMRLDTSALPAPLRLPALFDPDWRLKSPTIRWGSTP